MINNKYTIKAVSILLSATLIYACNEKTEIPEYNYTSDRIVVKTEVEAQTKAGYEGTTALPSEFVMDIIQGNNQNYNYSLVRSIIDDESKVSSMLINTSDICAVSGDLKLMDNGYIKLGYLDAGVRIKDGDMIVTSSISNKFLAGILIGYAKDVTLDANNLTQSGYLIPAVDFKHIQKVLVITEKKNTSDSQK